MAFDAQKLVLIKPKARTGYERWMEKENVPVVDSFGVSDLRRLPLRHWKRLGCEGAYLHLRGLDGTTGAYVGRLPAASMTEPEKHLYEKLIYIIQGEGVAEFQQRGRVPQSIPWRTGSLFAPPLNASHRLINHANEPALFLAVTTAPLILDHFHNEQFVFNSDFVFTERYDGQSDYFEAGEQRYLAANNRQWIWQTNFLPDVCKAAAEAQKQKRAGVNGTQLEIAGNSLVAQFAEWAVGRLHGGGDDGGSLTVILRSEGYSLMWPKEHGNRPYRDGQGDQVVRVDWRPGSVFSSPKNWFHRHFNTGAEPALHMILRCESHNFPLGVRVAPARTGVYTSVEQEGALGECEDIDPQIRRAYDAELAKRGIASYAAAANHE